jgi:hypothetical protein
VGHEFGNTCSGTSMTSEGDSSGNDSGLYSYLGGDLFESRIALRLY